MGRYSCAVTFLMKDNCCGERYKAWFSVEVEADSEEAAENEALLLFDNGDIELDSDVEIGDNAEVHDVYEILVEIV